MHLIYFITMFLYVWFAPLNGSEKGKFFLLIVV